MTETNDGTRGGSKAGRVHPGSGTLTGAPVSPPGGMLISHYKPFTNIPSSDITRVSVHPDS